MKSNLVSNLKVLYVEDEEFTRKQLGIFLKKRVGRLFLAENGRQALEIYREQKPDVIIADLKMSIMDGFEMAREIRKTDIDIPLIITTAFSEKDLIIEAVDTGIEKYLIKPIKTDELMEALEKISIKVMRLSYDGVITEKGLIFDRKEKVEKEEEIKDLFAGMLKKYTGKGPKVVKVIIHGRKIEVVCQCVLTKFEQSLLKNKKNVTMVNYNREIFYLDRKLTIQENIKEIIGVFAEMEEVQVNSLKDIDKIVFEIKG